MAAGSGSRPDRSTAVWRVSQEQWSAHGGPDSFDGPGIRPPYQPTWERGATLMTRGNPSRGVFAALMALALLANFRLPAAAAPTARASRSPARRSPAG